jgi:hypothetical protein
MPDHWIFNILSKDWILINWFGGITEMGFIDWKMEAPQIVLPGEVNPVRNSSGALPPRNYYKTWLRCSRRPRGPPSGAWALPGRSLARREQRGIISNGVNIITYCALGSAPCRPVRGFGVLDFKMKSEVTALLWALPARRSASLRHAGVIRDSWNLWELKQKNHSFWE